MMDIGDVLLFLHIIGAAGWIGLGIFIYFYLGKLAKAGGKERGRSMEVFLDDARQYGKVMIPLLLLTGIGLVIVEDAWSWSDTFVWVGIGAVVVAGVWQAAYGGKRDNGLVVVVKTDSSDRPLVLRRWVSSFWIEIAIVLVALWAMVTKLQ